MMEIGNWIRREERGTKWHVVESIVAGDAITKCGRRMEPKTRAHPYTALEVSEVMPLTRMIDQAQLCRACS